MRKQARKEILVNVKEEWIRNLPPQVVVHWDGKFIKHVTGKSSERVAILVTAGNSLNSPKLLGIPPIKNATGSAQESAVINLLSEWSVLNRLIAQVFDTTASNTGVRSGCAALIEKTIGRALLWLPCRHHVLELHIRHVWEALTGKPNSPSEKLFKRLQDQWEQIDHDPTDLTLFDWHCSEYVKEKADSVLNWGLECLERDTFPREDYRELIELVVIYNFV